MKKDIFSFFALTLAVFSFSLDTQAQLTVTPYTGPHSGATLTSFVQSNLAGTGITVSNATYVGDINPYTSAVITRQMGTFNATSTMLNTSFGFTTGITLSTGEAVTAIGPNTEPYACGVNGYIGNDQDDADLHAIATKRVYDKAILEFDFTSDWDSISFDFIFGSEEYREYVGKYNDPFGLFLSGPGISGSFSNSAVNLALVPGTSTPITINTVNDGTASSGSYVPGCANCAYFVYNGDPNGSGTVNPYKSNNQYIQFDGYTTKITARAAVTCGATYHLKLAVGDARDQSYTSGVFIRGNLATYPPSITQTINQTCSGGNITLDPNGPAGSTYSWSTGATTPTISISPGAYSGQTITVTITNTCAKTRVVNYVISCPLAVTLKNFNVANQETQVDLSWQTGTEKENSFFNVYRSEDGKQFDLLGKIQGAGYSTSEQSYSYTDERPLPGVTYYKIAAVDQDGNLEYSDIKSVQRNVNDNAIHVVPNPARENVSVAIAVDEASHCNVRITDAMGKTVFQTEEDIEKGMHTWNMDVQKWTKGVYFVNITTAQKTQTTRLTIQ